MYPLDETLLREDSPRKVMKTRRPMTEKQKAARLANLEAGRKKRMEMVKQKKTGLPVKHHEYDLSSNESDSSSDSDAFVISKKKRVPKKEALTRKQKDRSKEEIHKFKDDVDELKTMVMELAKLQKKQNKSIKSSKRSGGGTKIVMVPPNQPQPISKPQTDLAYLDALRKSLNM